jgi:subtilisin family serine protease
MKMKKIICDMIFCFFIVFLVIVFSCLILNNAFADRGDTKDIDKHIEQLLRPAHVPGELIIKFKKETIENLGSFKDAVRTLRAEGNYTLKKTIKGAKGLQVVSIPKGASLRQALKTYLINPHIEYAEPNYIVHASIVPDDTYFNNLWGLHNTGQTGGTVDADIDAPEAWNLSTGSDSVIIAVIDSGVSYNHPDLVSNIWINTGETDCSDNIDNDANGYVDDCYGWDFLSNDNDPQDYNGHGTHVAGTIAAVGNNSSGITGVMWTAKIMPLRFLGVSGYGNTADAIEAIYYANAKGAHVINNSWSGSGFSQALKDAIDASSAVVVCAASNESRDNDSTPSYPSGYDSPNIIAVAATDHNDNLASFSNYGVTSVDLAAPGVSIYSSIPIFSYGTPVTLYSEDFNSASGKLPLLGWDRGGISSTWAITTNTGTNGNNSLEDSPKRDYRNNSDNWAGYMTPFTSVKDNLYTLFFTWKGELETNYDYFDIKYSIDGITWDWIDFRTGSTNGQFISDSTDEITAAADLFNSFYFGFGIDSDVSITYDGVYIDSVSLTRKTISIQSYTYTYYSGTSMAAPHVSGVAGLIKALNPALSNLEIKDAILNNVDVISSLTGKVLTGGRLNAYNALSAVGCQNLPVRIIGTGAGFSSLQSAYDAAVEGDTIQSQAIAFTEDLTINRPITVTFEGGYDCDYTTVSGSTILNGDMMVSGGTITIENFVLQ